MNIGITFGGYVPLHQGHLDLIMQAKKENDIVLKNGNGVPRTHAFPFHGRRRMRRRRKKNPQDAEKKLPRNAEAFFTCCHITGASGHCRDKRW